MRQVGEGDTAGTWPQPCSAELPQLLRETEKPFFCVHLFVLIVKCPNPSGQIECTFWTVGQLA